MEIIAHRINNITKLKDLPKKYGAEIDLRSFKSKITLNHDPFKKGIILEDYLSNYNHGTLILNIKESGIEIDVIKIISKFKINFFLLDVEIPFIFSSNKKINKYLSIRFSEYESINTAVNLKNKVGWIWIDTFMNLPIKRNNVGMLTKFNSCLVCPERWGRPSDIKKYFAKLKRLNFLPSAVMTNLKYAKKWEDLIFNF